MVIVHLNSRRGGGGHVSNDGIIRGLWIKNTREVTAFTLFLLICVQLYIFRDSNGTLGDDVGVTAAIQSTSSKSGDRRRNLSPTKTIISHCTFIDTELMKEGLVCVEKCTPSYNNTLEGMGLDPNEKVSVAMPPQIHKNFPAIEYPKYRIYFPEEDIHLNLTASLANEIKDAHEKAKAERGGKDSSVVEQGYLHPRIYTERLLRRIVAKLLRAGVLDPSKYIVNTGSWIGDNALPWAMLLEKLQPENPGKVIAVDPSARYIREMVDLANVNGIGSLCAQVGVLSSTVAKIHNVGTSTEHIKVFSDTEIAQLPGKRKARIQALGSSMNAVTLDSMKLQKDLSLLHIDVEGHEGELLEGARTTIQSSRPIIITEGFEKWPEPQDTNDQHVLRVLTELNYNSATTIPELVGIKPNARNRIWWPDEETKYAAMSVIGKELERDLLPWITIDLPDV